MGVYKAETTKVKDFKFGELIPSDTNEIKNADSFELKSLNFAQDLKHGLTEESIRRERDYEALSDFQISKIVKDHRGLKQQEIEDYERRVAEEVERRVSEIRTKAVEEGMAKGKEEGKAMAYAEAQQLFDERLREFMSYVENVKEDVQNIYADSKENAYLMVKNLTKWVILKEVDEKYYLSRLLEKLIHEINSKINLVVHVNQESFGYMPEIIKIVERKVGKLTNIRVEADLDMEHNGIKLESENTVIDGSLEAQFESIDRLFANVGVNE